MVKKASSSYVVHEASFVSRRKTGCGMFTQNASRFPGAENAASEKVHLTRRGRTDKKSDFFSILLRKGAGIVGFLERLRN
jgi:hypothetical protein